MFNVVLGWRKVSDIFSGHYNLTPSTSSTRGRLCPAPETSLGMLVLEVWGRS